ncbi:hypothetical protein HDU76_003683 [Blyttiomyces sp. JEL0837]|nr:hypothetical protein HDU76_003683 [Blyttiomyces sp. JEL0837]
MKAIQTRKEQDFDVTGPIKNSNDKLAIIVPMVKIDVKVRDMDLITRELLKINNEDMRRRQYRIPKTESVVKATPAGEFHSMVNSAGTGPSGGGILKPEVI